MMSIFKQGIIKTSQKIEGSLCQITIFFGNKKLGSTVVIYYTNTKDL